MFSFTNNGLWLEYKKEQQGLLCSLYGLKLRYDFGSLWNLYRVGLNRKKGRRGSEPLGFTAHPDCSVYLPGPSRCEHQPHITAAVTKPPLPQCLPNCGEIDPQILSQINLSFVVSFFFVCLFVCQLFGLRIRKMWNALISIDHDNYEA